MLLFALWSVLALGVLAGAGYSHYRYRTRNNRHYERVFATSRAERPRLETAPDARGFLGVPVLAFALVGLLVPMSLVI